MRIYLDAAPVIFLVEGVAGVCDHIAARLRSGVQAGDIFVASDLTRFECRVHPLKSGNTNALQAFEQFFAGREVLLEAIPRSAWDMAAEVRAQHGLRTPDALHVAAAVTLGCELLLTADERLSRCPVLPTELVRVASSD